MGGVEHDAGDVDDAGIVESVEHGLVQPTPDTGSRPDQEPPMSSRLRDPKTGRQLPSCASGGQHLDDRRKQHLIWRIRCPAALRSHPRLLHREVHAVVAPRVEYSLMEHGLTLHTGLEPLAAWGQEGIQRIGAEKVPVDAA